METSVLVPKWPTLKVGGQLKCVGTVYEDGYLRLGLRGGSMKSNLRRFVQSGPIDLKTWIPIVLTCPGKGLLTELKNFHSE